MTKSINANDYRPSTLITHGGQAHRDDFICTCILLAFYPSITTVERRDPTEEELGSESVVVCDVGGRHEPEKLNFDHHQLPRNAEPTCALTYILRFLGLEEAFRLLDWFGSTEIMDSKGPYALATHLGLESPEPLFKTMSPVEGALLELFQSAPRLSPADRKALALLGRAFISHAKEVQSQMDFLKDNVQLVEVRGVAGLLVLSDNMKGMQKFRDAFHEEAAFCLSYDDRGEGWSMYRFNNSLLVDFSLLEDNEKILFAHKGGFIAKTKKRLSETELLSVASAAIGG